MAPACWLWDYLRCAKQDRYIYFFVMMSCLNNWKILVRLYYLTMLRLYFRRSCQGGFFLPLSGGVDSASSACVVYSMCEMIVESVGRGGKIRPRCLPSNKGLFHISFCISYVDTQVLADIRKIVGDCEYVPVDPKQLCNTILVTCYMGTENSSAETKVRAAELANQIGSYHHGIVIDTAISAILGIFQQVTKLTPRFKVQGGSPRENLALQNVQVIALWL